MGAIFFVLWTLLWVLVAIWPATIASRKGYSFILFLLLSWLFTWLLMLIIALVLPNKNLPPTVTPAS
jgi:hypothetical protein